MEREEEPPHLTIHAIFLRKDIFLFVYLAFPHTYPAGTFCMNERERDQDPPPRETESCPESGILVRTVIVRMVVGMVIGTVVGVSVPTPAGLLDKPDPIHRVHPCILMQAWGDPSGYYLLRLMPTEYLPSGGDYERSDPLWTRDPFQGKNIPQRSSPRNPFIREITKQGIFIVRCTDNVISN